MFKKPYLVKNNKQIIINQYSKDYSKRTLRLFNEVKKELKDYQKVFRFYLKSTTKESNYEILQKYIKIQANHKKLLEQLAKRLKINQIDKYIKKNKGK